MDVARDNGFLGSIRLQRRGSRPLDEQLQGEIIGGISDGDLRLGDRFPGVRELAGLVGVSVKVTSKAVAGLIREGWLESRRGIGCFVARPDVPKICKRVLLVVHGWVGSYYESVLYGAMADELLRRGCRLDRVYVKTGFANEYDYSPLELYLQDRYDLVLYLGSLREIKERLSETGMPVMEIGVGPLKALEPTLVRTELGKGCKRHRIRTVEVFGFNAEPAIPLSLFRGFGCEVKHVRTPLASGEGWLRKIREGAREYFAQRLLQRKADLPDLMVFEDDYVATGALYAMAAAGVSAPKDVKVVTWANEGNEPLYQRPLTMILCDPRRIGTEIARRVLLKLNGGRVPSSPIRGTSFRPGVTF